MSYESDNENVKKYKLSPAVRVFPNDVHKVKTENLWLEHAIAVDECSALVAFRMPDARVRNRIADLMEVQRQAGIFFAHQSLGVPMGHIFVLLSISLRIDQRAILAPSPVSGTVLVQEEPHIKKLKAPAHASLSFLFRNHDVVAQGSARVRFLTPGVYHRMRHVLNVVQDDNLIDPPTPDLKGAGSVFGRIDVGLDDHLLTDHLSDHHSAMSVIVAVEHAIHHQLPDRTLVSLDLEFENYLELTAEPVFSLRPSSKDFLAGEVKQNGIRCARISASTVEQFKRVDGHD